MKAQLSRRDILKLLSTLPLLPLVSSQTSNLAGSSLSTDSPNVLIFVLDSLSALHIQLFGYRRDTMPNLTRFAENSTVFHSHYSAGNYTTPSTASLFTGTYPWTHRALSHQATVVDRFQSDNLFSLFSEEDYTRFAFSHNFLVNLLLDHIHDHIDMLNLPNEISLIDYNLADNIFPRDYGLASQAERNYLKKPGKLSNSLFFSSLLWMVRELLGTRTEADLKAQYPRGVPGYHDMLYPLEDTIDWVFRQTKTLPNPFISYIHLMPPHDPYSPRREFVNIFWDGWRTDAKPENQFSEGYSQEFLNEQRVYYDEYIAFTDAEFGRFIRLLDDSGLLENTWIVFTSDHGEMFERGIWKHTTPTLFQPIIRIPLLISGPNQNERRDIYSPTSTVDLLPTLLHVSGKKVPEWCEGEILPPYNPGKLDDDRSIYVLEAKTSPKHAPFTKYSMALIKGQFKLIYYSGYPEIDDMFELYNLKRDPEEVTNIFKERVNIASELKEEMLTRIEEVNPISKNE
jgi:arylsulfatase A-like enzyme